MANQSILPEQIRVKVNRASLGMWVAESPDLLGFSVMSHNESSLRSLIREHIASICSARGFEVVAAPIGNVDEQMVLWSTTVRNSTRPSGPARARRIGRDSVTPLLITLRAD